jgi:methylated-DNA-[protein]-cysteine S-methyltransferase
MCTRPADTGGDGVVAATEFLTGFFPTPWGDGSVTVWQGDLAGVELPALVGAAALRGRSAAREGDQELLERWVGELEAYFRGERLSWTIEEVGLEGRAMSAFTWAVYEALLTVPPAVTVSYGALAELAGFPRAARAVGTAMATNPIPIVVPCHRVIRSDGSLGEYGSDPTWKERLLAHERRYLREERGGR